MNRLDGCYLNLCQGAEGLSYPVIPEAELLADGEPLAEEVPDMEKWQKEIDHILHKGENISDVTKFLITWMRDVPIPDPEVTTALHTVLKNVGKQLSPNSAMWVAFYFGAAWQRGLAVE